MSDGIIGDVVPALRFDEAKLKAHLESKIDGFGANMRVQQIKGGASNPTYKLTTDAGAFSARSAYSSSTRSVLPTMPTPCPMAWTEKPRTASSPDNWPDERSIAVSHSGVRRSG